MADHLGEHRDVGGKQGKGRGGSHVHDKNAGTMELVDDFAWWYADGRNEEARLLFDDDVNELR
jgi:hypothetical protein